MTRDKKKEILWISACLSRIKARCRNIKNPSYRFYGAKGIKSNITKEQLIELWERDKGFLLNNPSIDRIDPKGNYEVLNCRFIENKKNSSRAAKRKHQMSMRKNFIRFSDSEMYAIKQLAYSIQTTRQRALMMLIEKHMREKEQEYIKSMEALMEKTKQRINEEIKQINGGN